MYLKKETGHTLHHIFIHCLTMVFKIYLKRKKSNTSISLFNAKHNEVSGR